MEKTDKVTITVTLERNLNGTVTRGMKIDGAGFHYFEMVGLLQICCYELAERSKEIANELPDDQKVRIEFKGGEEF